MAKGTLLRLETFPRPHDEILKFNLSLFTAAKRATSYQILRYDEGQGSPGDYESNPENAQFAEFKGAGCYPKSHVENIFFKLKFTLTKHAWNTDGIRNITVGILPWRIAFLRNYTAIDELSQVEIQDAIELQTESTDRQGYPIYNGTDLDGDDLDVSTDQPGMTTNSNIEGVTFDAQQYFDNHHYLMTGPLLKTIAPKVFWRQVSLDHPAHFGLSGRVFPSVKHMNEYAACGVIIFLPGPASPLQSCENSQVSTGSHLTVGLTSRFNESNVDFNHKFS